MGNAAQSAVPRSLWAQCPLSTHCRTIVLRPLPTHCRYSILPTGLLNVQAPTRSHSLDVRRPVSPVLGGDTLVAARLRERWLGQFYFFRRVPARPSWCDAATQCDIRVLDVVALSGRTYSGISSSSPVLRTTNVSAEERARRSPVHSVQQRTRRKNSPS
jgi:hypothetical protein